MEKDKSILLIRSEFESYKDLTNDKLDKIFEKLKQNQFSPNQILGFLVSLITSMAVIMIYITGIKSDARNNSTRIDNTESHYISIEAKIDKLIEDVAKKND